MKNILILLFSLLQCALIGQQTWLVDNPHSNLRFEVGWQDFSMRTGEFKSFEGTMIIDSTRNIKDGVFTFSVDAGSVDVISDRLVEHVISDKFLDVALHPKITYSSTSIEVQEDGSYLSMGKLTICGISKDQAVHIKHKGYKETKKGEIIGLEITLDVNKSDFGLDWGSPRLGNSIRLVGHLLYTPENK